jgi:hypothetical protein
MWPFFHKSFEEYYCGLFVSQLGCELSRVSSSTLSSMKSLLYTRVLRHLLPKAPDEATAPLSFLVGLLKSASWSAVLEFAACEGGAAWLLSIYRPTLLARLPSVKGLRFFPADPGEEKLLFSREGVLLVLCAFDSSEATREEAVRLLKEFRSLGSGKYGAQKAQFGNVSTNAFLYCAAHDRADILKLLLQLFRTSQVQETHAF